MSVYDCRDLMKQAKAMSGDEESGLVARHSPLVFHIIKLHHGQSVPDEDDVQEGYIGLLEAIRRFDPKKGMKFSSFASRCIRHQLINAWKRGRRHDVGVSIEEEIGDSAMTIGDTIPAAGDEFSDFDKRDHDQAIAALAMSCVRDKYRPYVEDYFYGGMLFREVGQKHGVSKQRAEQVIHRELKRCRSLSKSSPTLWP